SKQWAVCGRRSVVGRRLAAPKGEGGRHASTILCVVAAAVGASARRSRVRARRSAGRVRGARARARRRGGVALVLAPGAGVGGAVGRLAAAPPPPGGAPGAAP